MGSSNYHLLHMSWSILDEDAEKDEEANSDAQANTIGGKYKDAENETTKD